MQGKGSAGGPRTPADLPPPHTHTHPGSNPRSRVDPLRAWRVRLEPGRSSRSLGRSLGPLARALSPARLGLVCVCPGGGRRERQAGRPREGTKEPRSRRPGQAGEDVRLGASFPLSRPRPRPSGPSSQPPSARRSCPPPRGQPCRPKTLPRPAPAASARPRPRQGCSAAPPDPPPGAPPPALPPRAAPGRLPRRAPLSSHPAPLPAPALPPEHPKAQPLARHCAGPAWPCLERGWHRPTAQSPPPPAPRRRPHLLVLHRSLCAPRYPAGCRSLWPAPQRSAAGL